MTPAPKHPTPLHWNQLPDHERTQLINRLTQRQHDCYVLWIAGCSYRRISQMLLIQPRTVRTHIDAAKLTHQQIRQEAA